MSIYLFGIFQPRLQLHLEGVLHQWQLLHLDDDVGGGVGGDDDDGVGGETGNGDDDDGSPG